MYSFNVVNQTLPYLFTIYTNLIQNLSKHTSYSSFDSYTNEKNYLKNNNHLPVAFIITSQHFSSSYSNTTFKELNNHFLDNHQHLNFLFIIFISVILTVLIILTTVGNLFVIAAILSDRILFNVQNYLVFSLAFADLMVAILVMPLAAVYEIKGQWTLGVFLCDIWRWADILCCTSSILHLLAIAIDRYWAVTYVEYMYNRKSSKVLCLIGSVWFVSLLISVGPLLGWKDADFEMRLNVEMQCSYSQELSYQLFATISTFYAPLIFILLLYWRIFQIARKRIRNKPGLNNEKKFKVDTNKNRFNYKKYDQMINKINYVNKISTNLFKIKHVNQKLKNKFKRSNITNWDKKTSEQLVEIGLKKLHNEDEFIYQKNKINNRLKKINKNNYKIKNNIQQVNVNLIENPSVSSQFDSPESLLSNLNTNSNCDFLSENHQSNLDKIINCELKDEEMSIIVTEIDNEKKKIITTKTFYLTEDKDKLNMIELEEEIVNKNKNKQLFNLTPTNKNLATNIKQKAHQDSKRERKTAKVLAIITGIFIICWLPFFALTLLKALIPKYRDYNLLFSIFIWLGWANSMINPIIYTIFSPDFRSAFKKILFTKRRSTL